MNESFGNASNNSFQCMYFGESYVKEKMIFIVGFGTTVATIGIATNSILVYLFLFKRSYRRTHFLYLGALAVFDICVCICFVMLFGVRVLYDFVNSRYIYLVYHEYVRLTFTITCIVQTASTYMIIAATAERFLAVFNVSRLSTGELKSHRVLVIFGVLAFAVISRISTFFELTIVYNPQCYHTFLWMRLAMKPFTRKEPYATAYKLYFNNIAYIFLPFILLMFFNVAILLKLRAALRMRAAMVQMSMGSNIAQERKESLKSATTTLVAIVTTYLACNVLGFSLTLLEHIAPQVLMKNLRFYTFASNTVSFLHLLNSAIRLFVYVICNKQFRESLSRLISRQRYTPMKTRLARAENGVSLEENGRKFSQSNSPSPYMPLRYREYVLKDSTV